MSAEVQTMSPEEQFQALQMKLANEFAAPIILDRLANQYGIVVNSPEEATVVVKAAFELFDMHQRGVLELEVEKPEETEVQKSAAAVSQLFNEVVSTASRYEQLSHSPNVQATAAALADLMASE